MRYGLIGAFAALALGAAIGAVLPVPKEAVPHEGSRHDGAAAPPELSIPPSADYDYEPPAPKS